MAKLQVKDFPDDLYLELKTQAKQKGMFFGAYVISMLERRATPSPKALEVIDTGVERVVGHATKVFGQARYPKTQPRYAKALIATYGVERVIGAIDAAKAVNGLEFAPSIGNLGQLLDKWVSLEGFYKKKAKGSNRVGVIR